MTLPASRIDKRMMKKLTPLPPKILCVVDIRAYTGAIQACGRARNWAQALEVLGLVSENGGKADIVSLNAALSACAHGGAWIQALRLLAHMSPVWRVRPDVVSHNAALSACGKEGHWAAALRILAQCDVPDVISYSAAISACGKGGQWSRACNLLGEMRVRAVAPNQVTYGAAIGACGRGQWRIALGLLDKMAKDAISRDVRVFSAAISACAAGDSDGVPWAHALALLERMTSERIPPNAHVFRAAIRACANGGAWRHAVHLLTCAMPAAQVRAEAVAYNGAIQACGNGGELGHAQSLFRDMRAADTHPDVATYTTLMDACEKNGAWEQALRTFDALVADPRVPLNGVAIGAAIHACARGLQWPRALQLLHTVPPGNASEVLIATNAALHACAHQWKEALRLLGQLARPDVLSYTAALSACANAAEWATACRLLRQMEEVGVPPNIYAYSAGITACANAKQWHVALDLFRALRAEEIRPDGVCYRALIEVFDDAHFPRYADALYREALASGALPSHWKEKGRVLDFHRFTVTQAKTAFRVALEEVASPDLVLIVGRGKHSDGEALLKPAMQRMLEGLGFAYAVGSNEGRLYVSLSR